MKLKRTVTIEFDRVRITTSLGDRKNLFCPVCRAESVFISEAETAGLLKILQAQQVFVKPENLHLYRRDAGNFLVCLNSIINHGINPFYF